MNWKRYKLILVFAFVLSTVAGCSLSQSAIKSDAERKLFKSYKTGITHYANIHDKMISLKYAETYRMYSPKETYIGNPEYPSVVKGERWVEWFRTNGDCILLREKGSWHRYRTGWYYNLGIRLIDCNKLAEYPWVQLFIDTPSVSSVSSAKLKKLFQWWTKDRFDFFHLLDERYYSGENAFSSELLYTGKEKDTVFLLYREYPGSGQAISTVSQQLKYNIETSSIIYFKSLKIEVLKATDEGITFRVLSDENVPWMRID